MTRPRITAVAGRGNGPARSLDVAEGLLAVARLLAGSLEIPEMQRRAARELTLLLHADTSIFFAVAHLPGFVETLATRSPVASRDVATDPRFDHPDIRSMKVQAKSMLYTPVFSRGTIRGAFFSCWWHDHHDFTADEIRLAEGVADQLALALENGALFAETRSAERRAVFLAEASRLLDGSLDEATVLEALVRGAVPALADWCAVDIVDAEKRVVRHAAAHRDPRKVDLIYELAQHEALDRGNPLLAQARVLDTEESELASEVEPARLSAAIETWPHLSVLRDAGFSSFLCVPLRARARILGTMLLVAADPTRRYTRADLTVAEDLAQRAALALDNAALYRESEMRRRRAEALATIGRLLSQTLEVSVVAERIVKSARELIGGIVTAVLTCDPATEDFTVIASSGDGGRGFRSPVRIPRGVGAVGFAVQTRKPVATADVLSDARLVLTDALRGAVQVATFRSALVVPLLVDDQVIGALLIGDRPGRVFRPDEVELAQSFGDQAAVALRNARMHEDKLLLAHEDGRRRVAYDLHDGIAQLIVGAKQHLDTCHDLWKIDHGRAEHELLKGVDRLGRAIVETRSLLRALRPTPLEAHGLAGAIRQVLEETGRDVGWSVSFTENLGALKLSSAMETSVFRIVQEAVTNVARHARAAHVDVSLGWTGTSLELEVRDDGVGFDVQHVGAVGRSRGLGLLSMRERAVLLGGGCVIESKVGTGTRVLVRVPSQRRREE
jgi:signal transduction histidine kinase